ncbi:MAG TPA: hypothetical protein VN193_13660 [Candidatus Angelobacter sp.]|jgi:hypothetical protein|nr:hypothetical protein [Candidatus Angelobacter sp.]
MAARDDLLDTLLAAPLDGFVEERNRLARELRAGGDRDTASWLASLRRPAPHVWAIDQVARRDGRRMLGLANLARRLAEAQSRAVQDRGAAREMQELSRELQRAVDDTVRRGVEVLRDAGHGVGGDVALTMAGTLRAALAAGDDAREQLERGRLLAPVVADFGFGAAPGGDVVPLTMPAAKAAPPAAAPRAEAEAAADAAEAAEREVFRRRTDQRQADEQVAAVRTRLQSLQAELSAAEEEAKAAAGRVRDAVEAARAARREADRLQSALPPD